jgi:hypothetical protein
MSEFLNAVRVEFAKCEGDVGDFLVVVVANHAARDPQFRIDVEDVGASIVAND